MIDKPPASGAVVHAYNTDAFNFANCFAKLLCDLVCQSKAGTAKPGYTPTVEKFCRDRYVEDTMNRIFVESGTDFSTRHGLPILAPGDLDYTGTSEGFGSVVTDDLLHAQTGRLSHQPEGAIKNWYNQWITVGFGATEAMLSASPETGRFCHGDNVTMDVCLVPQLINARNFDRDMTPFPTLQRISDAALAMPAFQQAMPSNQKDFE
jgi:hypothetical protein